MPTPWRFVDLGEIDAFEANAQLPVLARSVAESGRPIVTSSVWGRTHLNVGWFDDIDVTVNLEEAARLGVQVIRRPVYGGGTAFYGAGCSVAFSVLLPKPAADATGVAVPAANAGLPGEVLAGDLDTRLTLIQPVVRATLDQLGLAKAVFEGSSDLRWQGRKLGALTAQDVVVCDSIGGFLNIAPPDLDLYVKVARVPPEKFADKVVKDMREYVVTATDVSGSSVSYEDFRNAFVGSLEASGISLLPEQLTDEELSRMSRNAAKVADVDWICRVSSERFTRSAPPGSRVGTANFKGRKLCRAAIAIDANDHVVAALLAGDMHVGPPDVLERTAAALVGADCRDAADLRRRLSGVFDGADVHQADKTMGVTTDDLLTAVLAAVDRAG